MILDVLQTIINYSNLTSQIICTELNNFTHHNIYIYYLDCTKKDISQRTIEQNKFKKLKTLSCQQNEKICNVNHLKNLETFYCNSVIDQFGISSLKNLKILHCDYNKKINNMNHLANTLEVLYCRYCCGIDQNGICHLKNLKKLMCDQNTNIKSVSHLSNSLEELSCKSRSGIDQNGIFNLKKNQEIGL